MEFLRRATDFLELPTDVCPKCIEPKPGAASACGRCGVVFETFDLATLRPSEWLLAEWNGVCDAWQSTRAHAALRGAAATREQTTQLARMYRVHLKRNAGDAMATTALAGIAKLAMAHLAMAQIRSDAKRPNEDVRSGPWRRLIRVLRLMGIPVP